MSSDETYLEAFVESLTTLPHEIRRKMDLMKDLDASSSAGEARLRVLHQEYIRVAEERMMQLELVQNPDGTAGVRVLNGDAVTLPTTAEFERYIYQPTYPEILKLQQECLQKADEKVAIGRQAHDMIESVVQRLDRDLHEMEKLLQSSGDFYATALPRPDDLAACQVTPGSEWILVKVLDHDQVTGMYKVADEDVESETIYHLPESQVILSGVDKLSRGDTVFAVYPDTTSFYQAIVVQAPRKTGGNSFVMVNFVDDSDEFGITHDKAVPLKHIISPPFGVTLS